MYLILIGLIVIISLNLLFHFRLKSAKPFGSRESVKAATSQWGSSDPLDQSTSSTMGAMNGNPSMRSSTGAGMLMDRFVFRFLLNVLSFS